MDYITVKQAAEKWNISVRGVQKMCEHDRVEGAFLFAHTWMIPKGTEKPVDMRYKINKQTKTVQK